MGRWALAAEHLLHRLNERKGLDLNQTKRKEQNIGIDALGPPKGMK